MRPTPQLLDQPLPVDSMTLLHEAIVETRELRWSDESGCAAFATTLAAHPALCDAFIELRGDLGAGKTTFVRHLLRALGVPGRIKSPTYTVLETYSTARMEIAHFDFYRFGDAREWQDAGFRDVFAQPGLKLVEWPQHAHPWLPTPDLRLNLRVIDADCREVTLQCFSARGQELMR